VPLEQEAPVGQACSQVPQLAASVDVFVQASPHTISLDGHWQVPLEQEPPVAQTFPHDPQLFTADCTPIQAPSQKSWPLAHPSQDPPTHCGVAETQT
jgi:hypothetical protein